MVARGIQTMMASQCIHTFLRVDNKLKYNDGSAVPTFLAQHAQRMAGKAQNCKPSTSSPTTTTSGHQVQSLATTASTTLQIVEATRE